ncbi:MAG TPA: hypothetical protein VGV90_18020 [Solirubrobacteraceae bacterium]|nr:hypothetical protein [Solirubrobacteraceae bacterium]
MSRSATARTHRDRDRHHDHAGRALRRPPPHGTAHARRMSGPADPAEASAHSQAQPTAYAPPRARIPARPPLRLAAGGAAIVLRVADSAVNVSGSRTMDRLVRSRAWVVIIGVGLIGIVAMQVSMLKLNAGIGRAVNTVATLERSNASLKAEVSRLSSGDRIQALAGQKGFVMPEPADVTYLRAGDKRADGFRAARRMRAPDLSIAGPAGSVTAVPDALTATPGAATGTAGMTAGTTTATTAPTATATPAPSTSTPTAAPPAAAPATTAVTATQPTAGTTAVAPAPAAPQPTSAGGVTLP